MFTNKHILSKEVSGKFFLNTGDAGSGPEAQWSKKGEYKKAANHKKHKTNISCLSIWTNFD